MKVNTSKEKNFYTQSQQRVARILLAAWLLASGSPEGTLAVPKRQSAMTPATTTSPGDLSLASALPTLPPGGDFQLPPDSPGVFWSSGVASSPSIEATFQQCMSQEVAPDKGRELLRTFPGANPVSENLHFEAQGGESVRFHYQMGQWRAEVSSHLGAFSRRAVLPVVCSQGEDVASSLEVLSRYPSWQRQRQIHVLDRNVCPTLGAVVYLGGLGLKGGSGGEASGSGGTASAPTLLQARIAQEDIASTGDLVAALNSTQDPQERAVLEEWLAAYIGHFRRQSVQKLVNNEHACLLEYNQLTHILPWSERTKELLLSYFVELSRKIAQEAHLHHALPLMESLVYALNKLDKQVFGTNSAPLIELANQLLSKLETSQVVFSASGYPTHGTTLDALHQVLYLVSCIDPSLDSMDKHGIYQRFKGQLAAIDQAAQRQQHYPTSYHTQLLGQSLASLELDKKEAQLKDVCRRTFAGIQGLGYAYKGIKALVTLDVEMDALEAAYECFKQALVSDRVARQPWYTTHQAFRLSSFLSLRAQDPVYAYSYYTQFEHYLDEYLERRISRWQKLLNPAGRKSLRYGIVQHLIALALQSSVPLVRQGSIQHLSALAAPAVWGKKADVITALLDGLADVAVYKGIDAQERSMAYRGLAEVLSGASAGEEAASWLGGQSLDEKLALRPVSSSRPADRELFEAVQGAIARGFKPEVDLTPVRSWLDDRVSKLDEKLDQLLVMVGGRRHLAKQSNSLSTQFRQLPKDHPALREFELKLDTLLKEGNDRIEGRLESLLQEQQEQFKQLQEALAGGLPSAAPISSEEQQAIQASLVSYYSSNTFACVPSLFEEQRSKHVKDLACQLMLFKQELIKKGKKEGAEAREDHIAKHHERRFEWVKTPIAPADLFKKRSVKPGAPTKEISRILLTGDPGTGKTTLSRQLAYQWSVGAWGQAFEAVYLLPVRSLQESQYDGRDYDRKKTLATAIVNVCFAHDLPTNEKAYKRLRDHIDQELKKSTTLVILDGLDERAGASEEILRQAQKISTLVILDGLDERAEAREKILKQAQEPQEQTDRHKLLMLSRPYGVDTERRTVDIEIEHAGFNDAQLRAYVGKEVSDDQQKAALLGYIQQHTNIREIAHVPVNLQILCALWQDRHAGIRDELEQGSLPGLYGRFTEWVWHRYEKRKKQLKQPVTAQEVLFPALGQVALDALEVGETQISPGLIDKTLRDKMNIQDAKRAFKDAGFLLFQYVGEDADKANQRGFYEFPHLTFQEYFAGRTLAQQFLSEDEGAQKRVSEFISKYKYDPKYGRTLSFMAGEVSRSKEAARGGAKGIRALLKLLGKSEKEIVGVQHLLLKLRVIHEWLCLGQGGMEQEIQKVEKKLKHWFGKAFDHVRRSGYEADSTGAKLLDLLTNSLRTFGSVSKHTPGLLDLLKAASKDKSEDVREAALAALASQVAARPREVFGIIRETLQDKDESIREAALRSLSSLVEVAPDRSEEAFESIRGSLKDTDWSVRPAALGAFSSLVQVSPLHATAFFPNIFEALQDEDWSVRSAALGAFSSLVQIAPARSQEAFESIRGALQAESLSTRSTALKALPTLVQSAPGLYQEAFGIIQGAWKDERARPAALGVLPTLVQSAPELSEEIFGIIRAAYLQDEGARPAALGALSALVQAAPGLSPKVLGIIREACKDERARPAALGALPILVQVAPGLSQEAFGVIQVACEDEGARPAALGALSILVQVAPELSEEVLGIIRAACRQDEGTRSAAFGALPTLIQVSPGLSQAAFQIVQEALQAESFRIRSIAFGALSSLIQVAPGLSQAALPSVLAALQVEDLSVRSSASGALLQLSLEQLLEGYWNRPDDGLIPYIAPRLYHTSLVIKSAQKGDQQVFLYAAAGNPREWKCPQEAVKRFTDLVYYEQYGEFPGVLSKLGRKLVKKPAVGRSLLAPFFGNAGKDPSLSLGNAVIGKSVWDRYYGNVGKVPSLPSGIDQILDSPCPFWEGKQVRDTHLLVLIPKRVSGKALTLDYLGELIKSPQGGGHATQYRYYWDGIREAIGSQASGSSYWVLMTKGVLPESRAKSYEDQRKLVADHAKRTGLGYKVPGALEAAVVMLLHHVRSGERLYGNNPWTYTRFRERVEGYHRVVGGFSSGGLNFYSNNYDNPYVGVAGLRKF